MIANCGQLGLDWRTLDLSSYLETMEAHNEMSQPKDDGKLSSDQADRLRRAMEAHGG